MYGPPENRKDGGIHYAPEGMLDWSRWEPRSIKTPRRNHPKALKKKFAAIVGRKCRQNKALSKIPSESLQSPKGGKRKSPPGDHLAGGINEEDDVLFIPDNLAASENGETKGDECMMAAPNPPQRHIIKFKAKPIAKLGPEIFAEEPDMGLQKDDGLHEAKKADSCGDADNKYNGDDTVLKDSLRRKRKSVLTPDLGSSKRVRFAGLNGGQEADREPPVQCDYVTNQSVAEVYPDITGGEYDIQLLVGEEIFQLEPEDIPPSIHKEGAEDSALAHGQTALGTRTSVQTQILNLLTYNPGELDSTILAGYRGLLRQEVARVEKTLELVEGAKLLLGLRMPHAFD
jgi:hypothetical protein